jgi:iron complex outermembrane receptor protein
MRRTAISTSIAAAWTVPCAMALLTLTSPVALAQTSESAETMNEVVVTATRSRNSISKIGASISAITGDQLQAAGITDIGSFASSVPNLSVGNQFGVNRAFIRGIGMTSIDLGADGAVAFLQDGTIVSRPAAQMTGYYDVERLEVLRGPQGTLYGRGATAGAINLVTKKPTETTEGYARLTYGNYNAVTTEGALSGALAGGTVLGRIAGKMDKHDGYGKNLFTGNPVDDRDAWAVRGSLLIKASRDLDVLLSAESFREDDNNYALHHFGPTIKPENFLGGIIGGDSLVTYAQKRGEKPNLRNTYSDQETINKRNGSSGTATVRWNTGMWELKSVTSYRDFTRFNRNDLDASNAAMFGQNNYDESSRTQNQEFVASFKTDNLEGFLGAMYFKEHMVGSVRVPLTNLGILFGAPANTFNSQNYLQEGSVDVNAYGIFGQGTYSATDKMKLTLGARFSNEQRVGKGSFQFLGNIPTDKEKTWSAWTPTASVTYQQDANTMYYGSVTRGFKSGVINLGSQNPVIDPEFAWGYETGMKTTTADKKLSTNVSLFYVDYSDLQVGFVGADSVVTTVNAASARNYGAELELRARPMAGLELAFFGTYLSAKYNKFISGDYRQNFAQVNLTGNSLSNAPRFSTRLAASYDMDHSSGVGVNLHGDVSWQDKVYFTEFNNADAMQAAYSMINAGVTLTSPDRHWTFDIWGRNLTDRFIIANNIITAPLFSSVRVGAVTPPRTYGVTVGYNF